MALEGSAEAVARVGQTATFAYLSDPRYAGEWFAGAGFSAGPQGPPREGQTWSFARTPATRRILPVRAVVFEPPRRFVWRTQLGALRTNNEWELRCEPAPIATDEGGSGGGSGGEGAGEDAENRAATRLRLTLRLQPGPLGWLATLPLLPRLRGILAGRAQTAVTRAAEAAERHASGTPERQRKQGKQGKQKQPGRPGRPDRSRRRP